MPSLMDTEEMQRGTGMRGGGWLAASIAMVSGAVAASLGRWSLWWPHSDLRQLWATFFMVAVTLVTLWSLARALGPRAGLGRGLILTLWAVAVAAGATLGFGVLHAATLPYR